MAIIRIPLACFKEKLDFDDYTVHQYRHKVGTQIGPLQIMIEDTRNHRDFVLEVDFVEKMLDELIYVSDRRIIEYCADKAIIPYPYSEYN